MTKKILFTEASEQDALSIIRLRQRIWGTTYRGIYPDSMIDDFDWSWHLQKELERIRDPNCDVYLIVSELQNIGYLSLRQGREILLQSLYIRPEYQRQGIGRQAFDFIRARCRARGAESFRCHCAYENWNARRFYESMGGQLIAEDLDNEEAWQNAVIFRFCVEEDGTGPRG